MTGLGVFEGYKTKKEAVELGLKMLLQLKREGEARRLRGKVKWQGDSRRDEDRRVILPNPVSGSTTWKR